MDVNMAIKMDNLPQLSAELTPEQMQAVAGGYEILLYSWKECACSDGVEICYHYELWDMCDDNSGDCFPETRLVDVTSGTCGS